MYHTGVLGPKNAFANGLWTKPNRTTNEAKTKDGRRNNEARTKKWRKCAIFDLETPSKHRAFGGLFE